jgi:hypothetical protein
MTITQHQLHQLLDYDPETGVLAWLERRGPCKAGEAAGTTDRDGYIRICVLGRHYFAHRLVVCYVAGELPPSDIEVDHRSCVRSDNRFENLRIATRQLNAQNARTARRTAGRTSTYLGVHKEPATGRFRARIRVDGRVKSLGTYGTEQEASAAYIAAKRIHHHGNTL